MLKMLLIALNYLQKNINLGYSFVSCLGTNKVLNQGFYCDKHSKRAQNKYVKTLNLSTHHTLNKLIASPLVRQEHEYDEGIQVE